MARFLPPAAVRLARPMAWAAAWLASTSSVAMAQPADLPIPAATTDQYPPGIHVGKIAGTATYLDRDGRVLYGMDMRVLLRAGPDPARYCTGECAKAWEPVLAPPGSRPNIAFPQAIGRAATPARTDNSGTVFFAQPQEAPDWTIIAGPQGPQWVYKGWHMVFVRRGADARSLRLDGTEDRAWNTLKFVPPLPSPIAPTGVRPVFVDGRYALADGKGRLLFTGACGRNCGAWRPFAAGMVSAPVGAWRVRSDGDVAQWTFQGRQVFVCDDDDPRAIPQGGKAVQP